MTMTEVLVLFAATGLMLGTYIQMRLVALELPEDQRTLFVTIEEWRNEFRWWRPFKRRKQRQMVDKMLGDLGQEGRTYFRLRAMLLGWALLFAGAVLAFAAGITGPLGL